MVLAELGSKISDAIENFTKGTSVNDEAAIKQLLNSISSQLFAADINIKLVAKFKANLEGKIKNLPSGSNLRKQVEVFVYEELVGLLTTSANRERFVPKKGQSNVIMMVGLQGSGKTTTATKLALLYKKKNFRTVLVCADTFRAGAFQQLKQNSLKAGVHFYGNEILSDPVEIAKKGVEKFKEQKFDVIIVDTSGRHKQSSNLFQEMEQVKAAIQPDEIILVIDSTIGQAAQDQAKAFKESVDVGAIIVTKLDGNARGGGALSAVAEIGVPITFFGNGEHFNDLEVFDSRSFVSRLLGHGDVFSMFEKVREMSMDPEMMAKAPQMMERMFSKGDFRMRDLRDLFQTMTKMGSFSKILEMFPNNRMLMEQMEVEGSEQEKKENIDKKFKKLIVVLDSMCERELDLSSNAWEEMEKSKKEELQSRKSRIARGAGVSVPDVDELFEQYSLFGKMLRVTSGMEGKKGQKQLEKMAKNMGTKLQKGSKGQGGGLGDLRKMQNVVQQMQSAMKGKGGLGGLMGKMMKGEDPMGLGKAMGGMGDMGGMGGMGGLGDLLGGLGGGGGMGGLGDLLGGLGGGGGGMGGLGDLLGGLGGMGGGGGGNPLADMMSKFMKK